MRVTSFDKYNMSQYRLSQLQQYSNNLQIQMSSGKAYQKISESPVKANASLLVGTGITKIEQFQSNLEDLQGYVQTSESYLASAVDDYQRAMELGVQAANGTYNDQDRESFKLELNSLIEHMVGVGNSQHLGKYLFAGQENNVKPLDYDGTTVTYNGSPTVNSIRISSNMEVPVSVTAQDAFAGTIQAMIGLRDAISTGVSSNVGPAMSTLQTQGENLLDARSDMGVRMSTVDMVSKSYEQNKIELQTKKSKVEDADAAEVIMQFMNAQQLYQGTIQATLKMYESSLLNYM